MVPGGITQGVVRAGDEAVDAGGANGAGGTGTKGADHKVRRHILGQEGVDNVRLG